MRGHPMLSLAALLVAAGAAACRAPAAAPAAPDPRAALDWTLGRWEGVRRDGAGDDRHPMTMWVEPILGGAGQTRAMEVRHGGGVYRGFAVQVLDPARGVWERRYVNAVRGTFSSLEGTVEGDRGVWRSTTPGRTREGRVVSERFGDRWRRTMSVSEDGGATWRVLWIDELRRVGPVLRR